MPYPSRPDELKKRSFTISTDELTIRRINALASEPGTRSAHIRAWLECGLVEMVGPDWRARADRIIAGESERVA